LTFQEPPRPYHNPNPSSTSVQQHYGSTANLNQYGEYDDEDYEKQPLGQNQGFTGGFYPPASVLPAGFF
jgi:hypothetical protein